MALKDINFTELRDKTVETAKDVAGKVGEVVGDTVEKLKRRDILTAPFMVEMIRTATNMYDHGWDERNGGNISRMVDEAELTDYLDLTQGDPHRVRRAHAGREVLPGHRHGQVFQERPVRP